MEIDTRRYQATRHEAEEGAVVDVEALADLVSAYELIERLLYCDGSCAARDRGVEDGKKCSAREDARGFLMRLSMDRAGVHADGDADER